MKEEEIKKTDIWILYERARTFCNMRNMFSEATENYRMAFGNQWEGLLSGNIEPVQYNIIETIVNYKVSQINLNLWALNFSSENYDDREFRKTAEKVCKMLNRKASQVWEKDMLDYKVTTMSEDSAVTSEGIMYVDYDTELQQPKNEILNKTDVFYGNENSSDIQKQPYILIRQRLPLSDVINIAKNNKVPEEELELIRGDKDTFDLVGEDSRLEVDDMVTLITKLWKENGKIWFSKSTRAVVIKEPANSGLSRYPLAHMLWREKKGSSRGEGEVKFLIPNQKEINKTLMRYLLSIKSVAYPQKVINIDNVLNPEAINKIGATIEVHGANATDVNKVVSTTSPSSVGYDVNKSIQDLISITRDLRSASEMATGNINPEDASGRAILAVQQASTQPLGKQATSLKTCIEDLGRIWLDMWTTYSKDGLKLQEEITDEMTGEKYIQTINIPKRIIEKLKATVKLDVTPVSAFDRYARELTLENLLKAGYFNVENLGAFKRYVESLPDNSSTPKQDLEMIIEDMEKEQRKIAQINNQAQLMQQRASQFLNAGPEGQAEQLQLASQMVANSNTDEQPQTETTEAESTETSENIPIESAE